MAAYLNDLLNQIPQWFLIASGIALAVTAVYVLGKLVAEMKLIY